MAKAQGKLAVGLVLAIRDIAQRRPDAALKIGADVDWQLDVKLSRLANKVGHELGDDFLALWMGRQKRRTVTRRSSGSWGPITMLITVSSCQQTRTVPMRDHVRRCGEGVVDLVVKLRTIKALVPGRSRRPSVLGTLGRKMVSQLLCEDETEALDAGDFIDVRLAQTAHGAELL